uniref:Cadherin domain-containing protein n=1 Tax=Timema douglasi TaxID=61478 RepID=A0A7R8ZGS0_TIMDO|nr:unnamed protein product [Timema douglasi]
MAVMTMNAIDYDDINEGTNAKLIYSIEKNVIEEETGSPIFEIEPQTGIIKTAVCCLDRERTPDYSIQVVAMDGGGLKGTGTASIRVKDINDMPPQFTKDEWFTEISRQHCAAQEQRRYDIVDINDMPPKFTKEEWLTEVDETDGITLPETPILTVTVHDEDETNKFQYKIVDNSGYGADKFKIFRNSDGTGALMIDKHLDFEDPMQSNGFRFRIQVNDLEEDGDQDKYHVAYSWVVVKLRDVNDNRPQFERPNIEVSADEDLEVGERLERFKATDPDQGGRGVVKYSIVRTSDRRRHFCIDHEGTVAVQRSLDRENTPRHEVRILAVDEGVPPKTATATLTVIVQDINDNAPKLLEDYHPVVQEHEPPRQILEIGATDEDDSTKNNGPPFTFALDINSEDIIKASFKVESQEPSYVFSEMSDNGNKAVISSLRSFDREQQKEYLVPIRDVNDNKMQPGLKDIVFYNYMGKAPDSEIGRVFVNDLDDWDLPDKKFYWEGAEHPRFKLDGDTGMITMRHGTKEGRYNLEFKVYDRKHTQTDVLANVSVTVKELSHESVINSGSIRVSGITDEDFVRVWDYKTKRHQRSKTDRLRHRLSDLLNIERENVDVFSVQLREKNPPVTDVRFTARHPPYYKPVRLNGLVLLHREEVLLAWW